MWKFHPSFHLKVMVVFQNTHIQQEQLKKRCHSLGRTSYTGNSKFKFYNKKNYYAHVIIEKQQQLKIILKIFFVYFSFKKIKKKSWKKIIKFWEIIKSPSPPPRLLQTPLGARQIFDYVPLTFFFFWICRRGSEGPRDFQGLFQQGCNIDFENEVKFDLMKLVPRVVYEKVFENFWSNFFVS